MMRERHESEEIHPWGEWMLFGMWVLAGVAHCLGG
jgi:hypothetical protein